MDKKLDLTEPVQMRGGGEVELLRTNINAEFSVAGIVTDEDGSQSLETWKANGSYLPSERTSEFDLINAPPKPVKYYTNLYRLPDKGLYTGSIYDNITVAKEMAISDSVSEFIKTIEFEVP